MLPFMKIPVHENPLYVFLHVPKCAGSTFGFHLKHGLDPDRFLPISYTSLGALRADLPRLFTRADADAYLTGLPQGLKDRLRAVGGHLAYHGIHKHFDRPCRYIVFLRDPVARAVSHYQFLRRRQESGGFLTEDLRAGLVSGDGTIRSFRDWLDGFPTDYMVRYLTGDVFGVSDVVDLRRLEEAKGIIDACYYVGLTETYAHDALYLYHKIGVRRTFPDRNVSAAGSVRLTEDERAYARKINAYDQSLYEHAVLRRRVLVGRKPFHDLRLAILRWSRERALRREAACR